MILEKVSTVSRPNAWISHIPIGYDLANQTSYLDDMLRWSLDWLMKVCAKTSPPGLCSYFLSQAHSSNSTLYVQIGSGDPNDAYWGGDKGIPTPRPSYQINDTR